MIGIPPRTPVLVGVGQDSERVGTEDYRGLSAVELAAEAARRLRDDHPTNALDDLIVSEDALEGATAFARKRKPVWRNR